MAIALAAQRLTKSYGPVRAVDDVTFDVAEGEIFGFLGPNGAGKTTTIRMLLGLARPDEGRALVREKDPREQPVAARATVGYLPETLAFYPTLTGRQTLRFFADLRGVPRERVDEMIAFAGLEADANRRVGEYSRGMTQRLGLAQAFLGDPDILVLDEPTSGLDPLAQRQVKDLLLARVRRGVTLLFSSHQLGEVQELAHRVGVLRQGRLVAQDTVENLRERVGLKGVLVLSVERPGMDLLRIVRALPGVERARLDGSRLSVVCASGQRFEVAKAVHETGAGVIGMQTREPTLEDVFLQLTGDEEARA